VHYHYCFRAKSTKYKFHFIFMSGLPVNKQPVTYYPVLTAGVFTKKIEQFH